MKEMNKTKKQLIDELVHLRQRITEIEKAENKHKNIEKQLKESEENLATIKERQETEEALRESAAKNRSLLIAIPDLIFRLNKKGVFIELIPAKEFSLWKPPSGFLGKNIHEVFSEEIAQKFTRCVKQASKTGDTQIFQYQLMFNGKTYHHEARIVAFRREVLAVVLDFTKQREAEKMAETDPLTNVYNRRKFSQLLDQEIERVERYNKSLAVVLLDIDHFKRINDTFGHDAGDSVLKKISRLIRENIRSVETLARYGGEEFVIILPETNLKKAMTAAERIRRVIERKSFDKLGHITISAGVSIFEEGDNKHSIVKKADRGLYIAKREGRNRVSIL